MQFDSNSDHRAEQHGLAANLEEGQITGAVVEVNPITIDTAKNERWLFNRDPALESVNLKVGERVGVHYYITGPGKVYGKKIEKVGTTGKARERRSGERQLTRRAFTT